MVEKFLQLFSAFLPKSLPKEVFQNANVTELLWEHKQARRDYAIQNATHLYFYRKRLKICIKISRLQVGCSFSDASLVEYSMHPHGHMNFSMPLASEFRPFPLCLEHMGNQPSTCVTLFSFQNVSALPFRGKMSSAWGQQVLRSSAFAADTRRPCKVLAVCDSFVVWCFVRYMDRFWLRNIWEMLSVSAWWHHSD